MPRRLAPILAFTLACAGACAHRPPRPRLVVLIVIDQLPTWSFQAHRNLFHHGLARLLREGVFYPHAIYPYSATFTACGHAALVTGAPPSVTGMLANKWWDRPAGRVMEATEDPDHPLLAIAGTPGTLGGSPRRLRVAAVGDGIGQGKVVTVSYKDRSAILLGGQHPTMAIWYDPAQAAFTTSTYFAKEPPAWLAALAREHAIAPRLAGYVWTPLDADLLAREAGVPDDAPGEADSYHFGTTFPHPLDKAENPREDVEGTPLADEITLEAALAALAGEDLGKDDVPDFLGVSFSVHDYVGHVYGQEAWETLDILLREDQLVGRLLDALDAQVGRGGYAVILTSDHGAEPTIERSLAGGKTVFRVNPLDVEVAAEQAAAGVVGPGDWIAPTRDPTLYLSAAALALPDGERARLVAAVVQALRRFPGVGYAEATADLAGGCEKREALAALICRSIDPERSGEIFFGAADGSVVMAPPMEATGHGSAALDDRQVPVIVVEPGAAPFEHLDPVSTLAVAPTLARLLGVAKPPAAREAPLP